MGEGDESCGGASLQGQLKAPRGELVTLGHVQGAGGEEVDLLGHGHFRTQDPGVEFCPGSHTRTEHT